MLRKWKKYGCILFLLIALPYVITIFINGPMRLSASTAGGNRSNGAKRGR